MQSGVLEQDLVVSRRGLVWTFGARIGYGERKSARLQLESGAGFQVQSRGKVPGQGVREYKAPKN